MENKDYKERIPDRRSLPRLQNRPPPFNEPFLPRLRLQPNTPVIEDDESYTSLDQSYFQDTHRKDTTKQSDNTATRVSVTSTTKPLGDLKQQNNEEMDVEQPIDTAVQINQLSPSIPLDNMEILFEDTVTFKADKPYSFDWSRYGCRLHIPKGSINVGEEGTVMIYGIHSGPYFEVPDGMKLVSGIYYIVVSHELLIPATLEVAHCCNTIYNEDGECNLTFLTVSDDSTDLRQPYQFTPVNGGQFKSASGSELGNRYAMIKRTKFSPYAVAFINWVKYLLGYPWPTDEQVEDDPSSVQHKLPQPSPPLDYGALYCLIATVDPCMWKILLRLMEYLPSNENYFLRKERKQSNIVCSTFKQVELTSEELIIDVSAENGEPLKWNGNSMTIVDKWEILAGTTGDTTVKLKTSEIKGHELAPSVEISLLWRGTELEMTTSQFRIHFLGLKEKYSFPVIVPHPHPYKAQQSSSSCEGFGYEEKLIDPPDLRTFMRRVAYKAPSDCSAVALFILTPDGYRNFKATSRNLTSINEKYELFYEIWENEVEEEDQMSWKAIIDALEQCNNRSLAKKLQDCY